MDVSLHILKLHGIGFDNDTPEEHKSLANATGNSRAQKYLLDRKVLRGLK